MPQPHPVAATPTSSSSSSFPIGLVAAIGAGLVGVIVAVVARRGRRPALPRVAPIVHTPAASAAMPKLLDVSRRLTDVAATGNVDRAIVRDALGLVPADGAALVRRNNGSLTVAAESDDNLLVADALAEGVIAQVAETGQPLVQVSATERAIRNLPVALAAVPMVNGGRVEAVLVMIRRHSEPFVPGERDVLVALAPVAAAALQTAAQTRAAVEESLADPLTGVGNRRRFDAELPAALADDRATALCIVDLDHFKAVNDTYGHPAGDALLKQVAAVMQGAMRPGDSVYRIGGEEFALVLRHTTFADAVDVAERVRGTIAERAFDIDTAEPLRATASIGVAVAVDVDAAKLTASADAALYAAKESGRNRVEAS